MSKFVDTLRALNRKERFYLVGYALDNPGFTLGDRFRALLQDEFAVNVPAYAFVAMDYHFSWLYAAAVLASGEGNGPYATGGGIERGNQEDIDLLVAFDQGPETTLLILEAKGVTGWSNKQLQSKLERLTSIFGADPGTSRFPSLDPRFAILSPFRPNQISTEAWPAWMTDAEGRPHWVAMPTPGDLLKVTRCDEAGRINARGGYWKVEPDRVSARVSRAAPGGESG